MIDLKQAEHEFGSLESQMTGRRHPGVWQAFDLVDKLIIFIFLVLLAFNILLPFAGRATLNRLSMLPVNWLANHNGSWILAAGLLVLLLAYVFVRRFQIINDRQLWYDAGCPRCFERELVRIPRKRSDRWYGFAALPAFRYACRNCTWQGLRIARRDYWSEWVGAADDLAEPDAYRTAGFSAGDFPIVKMAMNMAAAIPGLSERQNDERPGNE
jgi:hypothetical protein